MQLIHRQPRSGEQSRDVFGRTIDCRDLAVVGELEAAVTQRHRLEVADPEGDELARFARLRSFGGAGGRRRDL